MPKDMALSMFFDNIYEHYRQKKDKLWELPHLNEKGVQFHLLCVCGILAIGLVELEWVDIVLINTFYWQIAWLTASLQVPERYNRSPNIASARFYICNIPINFHNMYFLTRSRHAPHHNWLTGWWLSEVSYILSWQQRCPLKHGLRFVVAM